MNKECFCEKDFIGRVAWSCRKNKNELQSYCRKRSRKNVKILLEYAIKIEEKNVVFVKIWEK